MRQLELKLAVRCLNERQMNTSIRRTVLIALSLSAVSLCAWIVFIGSAGRPIDRRVSIVSLSRTGKWLAAGTAQGKITVWDQERGSPPRHFDFSRGSLNDLQFDPDEQLLAIAGRDLGIYAPEQSAGPWLIRSDEKNYGTVRFSREGQTILFITGTGVIETADTHSGAKRLQIPLDSWTTCPFVVCNYKKQELVNIYHNGLRRHVSVSATGWVAYAGFGKTLRLWNPQTGQERSFAAARPASNLILRPDGTSIIFGTVDGGIESWDVGTGQRLSAMKVPGL